MFGLNYVQIGQAIRLAISNGWHLDVPRNHFSGAILQRCRKVWWTIFVLDGRMSALQGVPATINSSDVYAQLPDFEDDVKSLHALEMHVELSKIVASIQRST